MPRTLIFLFHGTGALKAEWIREGSGLRKAIQESLGKETVFDPEFQWPIPLSEKREGRAGLWDSLRNSTFIANRISTRDEAAKKLESYLVCKTPYNEKFYVIAHSHGGTIALKAIANTKLKPQCQGIVCLSTPFIGRGAFPLARRTEHPKVSNACQQNMLRTAYCLYGLFSTYCVLANSSKPFNTYPFSEQGWSQFIPQLQRPVSYYSFVLACGFGCHCVL